MELLHLYGEIYPFWRLKSSNRRPSLRWTSISLRWCYLPLDEGISTLSNASSSPIGEDIYFNGDKDKWIAAANTLKGLSHQKIILMHYLQHKLVSSSSGDMKFTPGSAVSGDTNLFWTILAGSRAGDLGNKTDTNESYLLQILDVNNALSRNHSKTDETARRGTILSTQQVIMTELFKNVNPKIWSHILKINL